jgi:hypothetical protein
MFGSLVVGDEVMWRKDVARGGVAVEPVIR